MLEPGKERLWFGQLFPEKTISLAVLLASFMFLHMTLLNMGNHAGEGYLSTGQREKVYYALQVLAILGFLCYAAADRFAALSARAYKTVILCVLGLMLAGGAVMLFAGRDSLFYLIVTFAVIPCLGFSGGACYHRVSREAAAGARVARGMGLGYSAAIALQYFLQIKWGLTPALASVMLAALFIFGYLLLGTAPESQPQAGDRAAEPAARRRIVFTVLIASGLLLFVGFYNESIHHLQIRSGYTTYNAYSWPRLMMIPGYLLFSAIGDAKRGRLVPVTALCLSLAALLNASLTDAYWLNMCLFYVALSGAVSYYLLAFWRLAPRTKYPALWAGMGRILDSAVVLGMGLLQASTLSAAATMAVNIAALALIIVLMAAGGDFNFTGQPAVTETAADAPPARSPEQALARMRERYALTPRETEVLRELVRTEDKQTVISERLNIQVKTLQDHVTRLYKKTGAATRSGLTELYYEALNGR